MSFNQEKAKATYWNAVDYWTIVASTLTTDKHPPKKEKQVKPKQNTGISHFEARQGKELPNTNNAGNRQYFLRRWVWTCSYLLYFEK